MYWILGWYYRVPGLLDNDALSLLGLPLLVDRCRDNLEYNPLVVGSKGS